MMMEGAGFEVIDLGINNPVENYLGALEREDADILGMSALLTTTMPYMKVVIDTLKEKGLRDQYIVMVGGAPLNEEFGRAIGADAYCRDAAVAVETAKDFMARKHNQMAPRLSHGGRGPPARAGRRRAAARAGRRCSTARRAGAGGGLPRRSAPPHRRRDRGRAGWSASPPPSTTCTRTSRRQLWINEVGVAARLQRQGIGAAADAGDARPRPRRSAAGRPGS